MLLRIVLLLILLPYNAEAQSITREVIEKIPFRSIGPAFMTGRISDIVKDPTHPCTWYVGVASGNVWKTANCGSTWDPIFDHYGSYSIGCLALDVEQPTTLWLGTGENQSQRSVGWGDGVYKSLDGGKNWTHMGLKQSEHIGKIIIHPKNSNIVYVAAQGPLWKDGGDRGLFRTMDGGNSWEKILDISKYTGITDIALHPDNPEVIYAASYQRRRHVGILVAGGPESRIYKSMDGGNHWSILKSGLPGGDLGRIALAVSPQKKQVVYALIAASKEKGGFYRSSDYGETWKKMSDYMVVDPQYYGEIYPDPHQFDRVYAVDVMIHYTMDGGRSFHKLNSQYKHVDNHSIVFDPLDPAYLMVGSDGGIYESWDLGETWKYHSNLPITQFYRVGVDQAIPFYNIYGGTQDNSTLYGPVETLSRHGISNREWKVALGGDGFQARIDPRDPNIVYCQYQYAGIVRYNKKTGEKIDIQPQPLPNDEALRWHWDAPLIISPHDPDRIYFAAQKVFRSDSKGDSWKLISPDLSKNSDRNQIEIMDQVWAPEAIWKNVFTSPYGTIVSMTESPLQEGLLFVGTDDGVLQISEDGGMHWKKMTHFPDVPDGTYVADLFSSQHDQQRVYAVFNNHKNWDYTPYILRSDDLGKTWINISGTIPEGNVGWTIYEDPEEENLLFLGTEYGLFCSIDMGNTWIQMKGKLPVIAIRDLEIHHREKDLIAASFGRGFYLLDDLTPLRDLAKQPLANRHLFPIDTARIFIRKRDLGGSEKGTFGHAFYRAPNPLFGAVFHIHLTDLPSSLKKIRLENQPKYYPSWKELEIEDRELPGELFCHITNKQKVVAQIPLVYKNGYQRISWDLRHQILLENGKIRTGPMVMPGNFEAEIVLLTNGKLEPLSKPQAFSAKLLHQQSIPSDYAEFFVQVEKDYILASNLDEKREKLLEKIKAKTKQILANPQAQEILPVLEKLRIRLMELEEELKGDITKIKRSENVLPGILTRLQRIRGSHWQSLEITETQRRSLEICRKQLKLAQNRYNQIDQEMDLLPIDGK